MPAKGLNIGRSLALSSIASTLILVGLTNSLVAGAKPVQSARDPKAEIVGHKLIDPESDNAGPDTPATTADLAPEPAEESVPGRVSEGRGPRGSVKSEDINKISDLEKAILPSSNNAESSSPEATKSEDKNLEATAPEATAEESATAENKEQRLQAAAQHWELSKLYFSRFDLDMCETELDLAILNDKELQIAHRDLCLVSLFRLNLARAAAEFMVTTGLCESIALNDSEAKELTKSAMSKHYKKGLAYARKKDWKEVVFELELAAHLVPDDYAVQRSLAFAYANLGDFNRAVEHYKTTFELAPGDSSSRADLAFFLAENGKTEEAFKQMEEAVETTPQAACYHVDLSWMAQARGDLETATKEMKTAIDLTPKQAGLWAHLGEVLEKKGSATEAADAYNHALGLDPMLTMAKERLSKLQEHHS